MNGDAPESAPWSHRRWAGVVFAVLAVQLAGFHFLSPAPAKAGRSAEERLSVRWLTDPARARATLDTLLLADPTLLAVASTKGFSGAAWLRPPTQEYQVREWTDTERSLAQPTQSLGAFRLAAPGGMQPVFDPARKPALTAPGITAAQPALRTASRLRIEGPISARALTVAPPLRSWPHSDVLADSRVEVLVNDEGLVFSPRLASAASARPSVQHDAHQHALELARALRFAPVAKGASVGPGTLVEGTLIFQWHTVEPPAGAKE